MSTKTQVLPAPPQWRRLALASDIHLSAQAPETAALWHHALANCDADALILLGDYFDVWVGDDLLNAPITNDEDGQAIAFWQDCAKRLRAAAQQRPVFWMAGNRDFLVGQAFAQHCGLQLLDDPCLLTWHEQRYLLSHGDAWCTDDADYMAFRTQVRSPEWQRDFLRQPLTQRLAAARQMRAASQAHHQHLDMVSDIHGPTALRSALAHGAKTVIHGHTHQGISAALSSEVSRHVTLDWEGADRPPRAQWLVLEPQGITRVDCARL